MTDTSTEQEDDAEAEQPEMRAHYSFKGEQRGRYAHLFPQETPAAEDAVETEQEREAE